MSSCYNHGVVLACPAHCFIHINLQCVEVVTHDSESAQVSLACPARLVGLVARCDIFWEASTKGGIFVSRLIFFPLCLILDGFISCGSVSRCIIFRALISWAGISWCWLVFHHLIDFWVHEVHLLSWISVLEILAQINLWAFLYHLEKLLRAFFRHILLSISCSLFTSPSSTWASTALWHLRDQPATSRRPLSGSTAPRRYDYLHLSRIYYN